MNGYVRCRDCVFNEREMCHFNPPKPFIVQQRNALGEAQAVGIGVLPVVQPEGFCINGLARPIIPD